MNRIIRLYFISTMIMIASSMKAQDKIETTLSTDIVSQYIWRGMDLGSVSLQPTLGIGWKGLELTGWGSVGLSDPNDTKEIDLTLSYYIGGFNIGITDYWTNDGLDPRARYFKYEAHETNHVFEANIGYDFDFASLQWYTNFTGNDGFNNSGDRAFSSYFEVNVPFRLATVDWTATAGAVPYATSFYDTDKFAVTNLALKATKDIRITDSFSIPIFGQFVANPHSQKAYLIFGISMHP